MNLATKEVLSFLCLFGQVSSKKTICDITFLFYFDFVLWNPHNTWIHLTNNMTYQLQQTTKLPDSNWIPLSEFQSLSWVISTTHAKIPISCSSGRIELVGPFLEAHSACNPNKQNHRDSGRECACNCCAGSPVARQLTIT